MADASHHYQRNEHILCCAVLDECVIMCICLCISKHSQSHTNICTNTTIHAGKQKLTSILVLLIHQNKPSWFFSMAMPPGCLYKQNLTTMTSTTLLAHGESCKTKLQSFGPCYGERSGSYPHGWFSMKFLASPYLAGRGELMWVVRQLCAGLSAH